MRPSAKAEVSGPAIVRVTISGPPGSGTTTAARQVGSVLGLDLLLGGEIFREMAVEHGMSLLAFGAHASDHPEVDVELDARLAQRMRDAPVVVESRLAGWIAHNEGIDALKVGLVCSDVLRARRVAGRERVSVEQALADNAEREKVEHDRYLTLYGIDIVDLSIYDLVIDTGKATSQSVAKQIVKGVGRSPAP